MMNIIGMTNVAGVIALAGVVIFSPIKHHINRRPLFQRVF